MDKTELSTGAIDPIYGNRPLVKSSRKTGIESTASAMETNAVSKNTCRYPIDNYLVPAVIGNSNYLQLSNFRESSSSVEPTATPHSETSRLYEPKNGKSNSRNQPNFLDQPKSLNTRKDLNTNCDEPKSTPRESKMEEIDCAMQTIRKQIMQSELDIMKLQAESMMKIDDDFRGKNISGGIKNVQEASNPINNKKMIAHHRITHDGLVHEYHSLLNTSEKTTCLCCYKPKNFPLDHKNSRNFSQNQETSNVSIDKDIQQLKKDSTDTHSSHKRFPMENCQQFHGDLSYCEKTTQNIRRSNSGNSNRRELGENLEEVQEDNREQRNVEKSVHSQVSKNDCCWKDRLMRHDNSFESHGSGARNMPKLDLATLEGFDRSPEEFIENELPQLITDTRSQSRYASSVRLDNSCEGEDISLRMGSTSKKQNVGTFKPNAALHRVVSQESSTNLKNHSEIHQSNNNSKLSRLKKALLPGVNIRSELSVQSGPTIHIPAASKFLVSSEKNKNVLLKEIVHVETEREIIICPPRNDLVENVVKNNVVVKHKVEKPEKDSKPVELSHPQTPKSTNRKVVEKQLTEGLSNNEIQEHLYNAVRTYANKLNSQNNTKIQKQLKETLQELSFNISRLYNNQMNEYVQCGRNRDIQAPLSYRMKAVAELLWEELELRTYPSEEHYSQIEQIIHHLVNDLEDAIIPLKSTIKGDIPFKTSQPTTQGHEKNLPIKNNHLDCFKDSTQFKAGGKNSAKKNSTTKFSYKSTSSLGRSYVTERNEKCDRRLLKGTTSQLKPDSSSNSKKITETAKNGLRKDENKFTVVKRSTYFNEFDGKGGRTSSNKNCRETESIQRSSKDVRLEGTSAKDPCSMSKDLSGTKQVFSEKSQFISDSPSRENSDLRNDSTGQNDQSAQIFRPRSASDDEDLMRFKRINTLYKLNKKLHSPIKTTAEIFSDESVTHDQCDAETTKKMTEHSSFDTARKNTAEGDVALPKNTENSSPLETNGPEVNQTPISNSEESIDQQIDGEVDDGDIVNESQLTNDGAQNTVKEITPQSMEQENSEGNEMNDIKIRLETVEEETEPSASHKSDDTDRDKSSNKSEKSEKEKDDESYEDDWEIDQDEVSLNQDENSPAHKHQEPKDVKSHHSIEESLSSSSTTSLSVVSEIKNDKSSKSGDSIQEGTYVKEKSPSKVAEIGKNHNEHLRLNESTLDGLKLSLHSDEDINKEVTKDVIIADKQDSIHEEVIESGGSKTFDVIKDVDVDGNNTVTISSSVSSEILQNDGKFDLNSEDFTTVKNMNANLLIPLSARSNTTAEIRSDSAGMNAENSRIIREMKSDEIINNKGQCDKMCTNDAKIIPSTSFHLSIPKAMDHQQNTITMISNLKNQEFKVTLELNKNHVGTLNCVKSSSDDYRVKSRSATEGGMEFEQKPCKSVNTEPIVENFETFHGRSRHSGLNGNNLSGSQVQEVAGIVKQGGVGIVDQGVARIVDQGVSRIVDQGNAGIVTGNQGVFEIVNQEVAKIVDQGSVKGVTQEMHQKLVQQIDWEAKFHDLSQLRNRVEGLESTLTSTVGAFLERLNSGLADKTPCTSGREVGISCKLNELRSSHCQTDDFLVVKPAENIETQLINNEENIPAQKTSLTEEINKILNFNRGGAEKNPKKPVNSSTTNENFLQRKYGTQSSSSKSSSLLSIARLSASEEKSQSELSEGEMGMEAAICSCSFGEIKMSGCSRCGPYGVKKLSIKRSYPNLQKSDGEMSVKNVQHSSSDYSASHSVDYYTKLRLDVKRDSKTMFKFKSKSLSQNKVAASKSFTNVVEGIMNELKKEKMEARMKFKRSQDNFDAQFFKHSESLMRSASEISLRMKSSVVDHATASSTQKYSEKTTHQNFHRTDSEELLRNSQPLTRKSQINNISSMEVVSDESGDSEVAVKELQELDSNSLFRLIRKRKNRQLHENRYQDLKGSEESSTKTDVRGELKLDFDLFTAGKSKSGPVIDEPNLEEIGTSTRVQSIEEVLKTFFSSTGSSEHEPAGKTRQNKFYEGESSLIRTRKDLLDNDSCDSTILSNTSEDRDRSEGQI